MPLELGGAPVSISPTGSPFSYTALNSGFVLISGGTVTLIEYGRAGVFTVIGTLAGMWPISRGDVIRVSYAVAPTITYIPR